LSTVNYNLISKKDGSLVVTIIPGINHLISFVIIILFFVLILALKESWTYLDFILVPIVAVLVFIGYPIIPSIIQLLTWKLVVTDKYLKKTQIDLTPFYKRIFPQTTFINRIEIKNISLSYSVVKENERMTFYDLDLSLSDNTKYHLLSQNAKQGEVNSLEVREIAEGISNKMNIPLEIKL